MITATDDLDASSDHKSTPRPECTTDQFVAARKLASINRSVIGTGFSRLQRKRLAVFVRDRFKCAYCDRDLLADIDALVTATVDHVLPRSQGGTNRTDNLVACCSACNRLKSDATVDSIDHARALVAERRASLAAKYAETLPGVSCSIKGTQDLADRLTDRVDVARAVELLVRNTAMVADALRALKQLPEAQTWPDVQTPSDVQTRPENVDPTAKESGNAQEESATNQLGLWADIG